MHEAVQAIAATGISPIVRVVADEGWMVKRALDCGAHVSNRLSQVVLPNAIW